MVSKIVVILSPVCFDKVQFRFPRTSKKRINKKWKKRKENYKEIPSKCVKMKMAHNGCIIAFAHPNIRPKLEESNSMRTEDVPEFIIFDNLEAAKESGVFL